MKIIIYLIFFGFLFGCASNDDYQIKMQKLDNDLQQVDKLTEENSIFDQFTNREFLRLYSDVNCGGTQLNFDSSLSVFSIKTLKEKACLKKWSDVYIDALNESYGLSKIGIDNNLSHVIDLSKLESTSFESLESNMRYMYRQYAKKAIRNEKKRIVDAEDERQQRTYDNVNKSIQKMNQGVVDSFNVSREPANNSYQAPKQIEYNCLNKCLNRGYMYNFCQSKCEY